MIEVGILHEDERLELIQGEIVHMSPKGSQHAAYSTRLGRSLISLGDNIILRFQDPIVLNNQSEPEPDIAAVFGRSDDYISHHPTPADVVFLIEIADSSLLYDRRVKIPLYASEGIPEYWIVNIPEQQIEVYLSPSGDLYEIEQIYRSGEQIPLTGTQETLDVQIIFAQ